MTEATSNVSFSLDGDVATVTIDRPNRMNALDLATLHELETSLVRAAMDPAVRCLVITGTGRAFSAGADVKEWANEPQEPAAGTTGDDWVTVSHRVMARLYRLPKPAVAAVNGVAVGAGLDLALACDFRYASEEARFGSVYIRIGFSPDAGASFLLPRIVGITKAKELIYTGRIIGSPEAEEIGLVSRVVPGGELMTETMKFARELAAGPTVAIGLSKENIQDHWAAQSFEGALKNEQRAGRICATTADHKEGLSAVNEKREPHFEAR